MWWSGDNRVRARTFDGEQMVPETAGIVDVRNEFARLVGRHAKVAVVLNSDEHAYHRILVDRDVPAGVMNGDDANGDGKIDWPDESCSPLRDLRYPTWYVTSGGAGAPYYSEESTPWNAYWKADEKTDLYYRYSSQENMMILSTRGPGLSLKVFNLHGELLDEVADLMAVKRQRQQPGGRAW
jgi:hypothetical protein